MKINKIEGLVAAPFTPMKKDGSINSIVVSQYANKLKDDNLSGVFICGTTGEGMLMTNEERKKVAEEWLKEQTDKFKIIVHVGTTSAKQSKKLAEHAQDIGAYAVGCIGPTFLKPQNVESLADFCAEVASGAPGLPFYYYNIPSVSGINQLMHKFLTVASAKIPNLVGIKFTDNNLMDMQQCLHLDYGKWDILHGYDELLLAGLTFGVKGAVGSTYNIIAPLYQGIIADFKSGNMEAAREKQFRSIQFINILLKNKGAIVAGKAAMSLIGIDCGGCRPPLPQLTKEEVFRMETEFKEVGFSDNLQH